MSSKARFAGRPRRLPCFALGSTWTLFAIATGIVGLGVTVAGVIGWFIQRLTTAQSRMRH